MLVVVLCVEKGKTPRSLGRAGFSGDGSLDGRGLAFSPSSLISCYDVSFMTDTPTTYILKPFARSSVSIVLG